MDVNDKTETPQIDLNDAAVQAAIDAKVAEVAGGLKKSNDSLLGEVKKFKELAKQYEGVDLEEYQALKESTKRAEESKLDATELRKRLDKEYADKLTAAQKEAEEARSKLDGMLIDNSMTSELVKVGVAKEFMDAAKALLKTKYEVSVSDGGAVIDGQGVTEFLAKWSANEGKAFIGAPANGGGGARGGNGAGGAKTVTRAEFDSMTHSDRARVSKEGFKIID